jgi:monofunctional biosynthetic peptidoglycan transglycosylase
MLGRQLEARLMDKPDPGRQFEWLPLARVPEDFVRFTLVAEDQRFYLHRGFDWQEIEAARRRARREGGPVRGASTITQQCARSLFLWQGRSWLRKGLEAYYTFWMEMLLPKRRILELYVNVIETGDGVYGVGAAARAHYSIPARQLTREQCAMLVALLPAPRTWNPRHPSPRLAKRHAWVLKNDRVIEVPSRR